MQPIEQSVITCNAGVAGDKRGKPGKRQVTLLSQESWQAACRVLSDGNVAVGDQLTIA